MSETKDIGFSTDLVASSSGLVDQVDNPLLKKIIAGIIEEKSTPTLLSSGLQKFGDFSDFSEFINRG